MVPWVIQVSGLLVVAFVTSCTGQNTTTPNNSSTSTTPTTPLSPPKNHSKILSFDCRRGDDTCNGKECNLSTGKCQCDGPGFNYACLATGNGGVCTDGCTNGVCNSSSKCVCDEGFYGDDCSLNRAQVFCRDDKMFVNINPIDNFDGLIYVQGAPNCQFVNNMTKLLDISAFSQVDQFENLQGWFQIISKDNSQCRNNGGITVSKQGNPSDVTVYIQYSNKFKTSVDQLLTARCGVDDGNATVGGSFSDIQDDNGSNLDHVDTDGKMDIVTLKIQKPDGSPVAGTVLLGEEIHLVFTMTVSDVSVYRDFRLVKCVANNTKSGPDLVELPFVSDGCPENKAKSIFSGLPSKTSGKTSVEIDVSLKAFMFVGSSSVAFQCDIAFCDGNNTTQNCEQKTCPGFSSSSSSNTSPTRRKRSSDTRETSVTAKVNVADPAETNSELTSENSTTEECHNSPDYTVIVAILGACVFVLLAAVVVLIFMLRRSTKMTADQWPRPVERLRFPRLELNSSHNDGI